MFFFLGWIFFCIAAGMFAHFRRDRRGVGWFFVAFFFSPLVAFVLLAILDVKPWVETPVAQRRVEANALFAVFTVVTVAALAAIVILA
jgi:uncharacterized membrane protein (DUF485 family)